MMKVTERRDGTQYTPVRFLEKKQILVVNEPRTANLVRMSLELEGYEVLEASTGAEALNYIYAQRPDLVILDIQLPDDNGLRIVRLLREHSSLPVIILTEQDSEAD